MLEAYPEADLRLFVVWTDVLAEDGAAGARRSSAIFAGDPRAVQFHDPERVVGRTLAPLVRMPSMAEAARALGVPLTDFERSMSPAYVHGPPCVFDTLFFFDGEAVWGDAPPAPLDWVTQLDPGVYPGIDPERFRYGPELRARVGELAARLLGPSGARQEDREEHR